MFNTTGLRISSLVISTSGRARQTCFLEALRATHRSNSAKFRSFSSHGSVVGMSAKQSRSVSLTSSRDHPSRSRRSSAPSPTPASTLRKTVMEEVAIPGKYQMYFKPDKRAIRKAEGSIPVDRSRSPKKVSAARWKNSEESAENQANGTTRHLQEQQDAVGSNAAAPSRGRGFENVAWRALEQAYARDVMPHPYLHRDYLEITEIKLLPDRKTFQLWYRLKPDDQVSEDRIAEAVDKHAAAFKAMLARYARTSTSSRLVFQLTRQSDLRASMSDIWTKLEQEALAEEPLSDVNVLAGQTK